MKNALRATLILVLFFIIESSSHAQEKSLRSDKLYTMSGFGFSFPVGGSSDFMRSKFSTTIGANLGLGNGGLFLYPKVNLHVFGYDNYITDPTYNYNLEQGRATTYLLNVALGYRKMLGKFAYYGYLGVGAGFILTPRVAVSTANNTVLLNNKTNHMGTIEPGAGIEYNIGGANLFIETSFMHGLGDIGGQPFNAVPITIGIKPNLSKIFR
jgi:outer membrane autotransporter protein